jgi:hypothetical protein
MTEYEFLEAGVLYYERILDSAMNLITVVLAYLAASHFVGERLPRAVAIGLSTIYSLWIVTTIAAIATFLSSGVDVQVEYQHEYPGGWVYPREPKFEFWLIGSLLPMSLAWIGSLYYLHFVVRRDGDDA